MDLNQRLFQHRIAVMRTDESTPEGLGSSLSSPFALVSHCERRVARLRDALGAPQHSAWLRATLAFAN